jgi:hypothetical protein
MNKNVIIAAFIVIFGISLFKSKSMFENAINKKYGSVRGGKFLRVFNAIKKLPLSKQQLTFLMAQIMVETGVFTSRVKVFDLNNNASGILYTGSAAQIANGATRGSLRPASEGGNYARFENLDNWAKEYFRVLNKGVFPLNSSDIKQFTTKLKENRYFADPLEIYLKNITFFYNFLVNNKF